MTMLHVHRGDTEVSAAGMGGPKVYGDDVMNEYRGQSTGCPIFVMARVLPHVTRVVATTDSGLEIELKLSAVITRFGLRFAVAALPDGEVPGTIRAESEGTILQTMRQPMFGFRPPRGDASGGGWFTHGDDRPGQDWV